MKYAIVTGSGSGLGNRATMELAERNYMVFALDINLDIFKENKNSNIIPIKVDVTSEEDIKKAYEQIKAKTDKIYVLANFAGICLFDSLIEGNINKIERLININLLGIVRINKIFFPLLKNANGRIINISSENGYLSAPPFNGAYTMSKYALEAYNDSLRRELNFFGIKVIKLQLGSFKTNMHNTTVKEFEELSKKSLYYQQPLKKMGKMMMKELENHYDMKYMIAAFMKAVESKNPKLRYRVKNSKTLRFISILPEKLIDKIYLNSLS